MLLASQKPDQNHAIAQVRREIRGIDRKVKELAGLLTEVRHRRPLIQRIDALEDERQSLAVQLEDLESAEEPKILGMSDSDLEEFAGQWRSDLEGGTMEKRKAMFRQLIDAATFDGEVLELVPNLVSLTGAGVKVASPRGFEPLSPP